MLAVMKIVLLAIMAVAMTGCADETAPTPQTGRVTGRVVAEADAAPVPSAVVSTTPPTSSVLTDVQGTFTMVDVPAGTYLVKAEKGGQGSGTSQVAVTGGKTTQSVIVLKRPDPTKGDIIGTVRSANDNSPIDSVLVELVGTSTSTLTAANGVYTFTGLVPGMYQVRVSKKAVGTSVLSTTVTAGSTSVVDFSIRVVSLPPVTDGLVAYFPLDGRGDDISGGGFVDTVTIQDVDAVVDRKGIAGGASRFRGTDDSYMSAVVKRDLQELPLTISWWMRRSEVPFELESVISKYVHPSGEGIAVIFENGNLVVLYSTAAFSNYLRIDATVPAMDEWVHCAISCSNMGARVYFNGQLALTGTWSGTPSNTTTDAPLRFGLMESVAAPGLRPAPYSGQLDDVAWYNRVLKVQEIQALANDK
jgi:hypothetical protein